jgi:hypothetical protein
MLVSYPIDNFFINILLAVIYTVFPKLWPWIDCTSYLLVEEGRCRVKGIIVKNKIIIILCIFVVIKSKSHSVF